MDVSVLKRFWAWTLGLALLTGAAMLVTLPSSLGFTLASYNVAFAVATAGSLLAWRVLKRRRVATLLMAYAGVLATITGFVMLYSRDLPAKEWITWWHGVTSFALLLLFLIHWLNNHPRLWEFAKRLFARDRLPGVGAMGAWVGSVALGAWTLSPSVGARFTRENYLHLASWAVLAGVALAYGLWLVYRLPSMRRRLARTAHRNRARALVDTSLFLAHWGALVTGFALLYFAAPLRAGPLKYVSKWWHTATSVAFLALVALHVGFNARLLAAHARRVDDELGTTGDRS